MSIDQWGEDIEMFLSNDEEIKEGRRKAVAEYFETEFLIAILEARTATIH